MWRWRAALVVACALFSCCVARGGVAWRVALWRVALWHGECCGGSVALLYCLVVLPVAVVAVVARCGGVVAVVWR